MEENDKTGSDIYQETTCEKLFINSVSIVFLLKGTYFLRCAANPCVLYYNQQAW